MQADDNVSSFKQLVEHAEALQHDVEQAEHHRQADDDRAPCDAAEHDLVEYIRKHRGVLQYVVVDIGGHRFSRSVHFNRRVEPDIRVGHRTIPLDPPGDRSS